MSQPVTVSITRTLDPGHDAEMLSWLQAGTTLAQQFPGFLGAGWVRPEAGSDTWHMLYRFADDEALQAWEHSPQRQWWRSSAVGLGVVEARRERRTGIEGWFDDPAARDVEDLRAVPAAPPRWKQASVIFLVFYPLSVLVNWLAAPVLGDVWLPLRVLVVVLVMTPVMTYVALPWMTRRMEWWLHGRPAPWTRAARAAR
ncbi:antibiotic biosynthesis monooxygenase [Nocardioides marmotae]|uniref:Antibiotic biosynthesis monooxygenase n=1 Tax=Nocardioides marmotae TaxID=2663857 RepID=A0A6I3JF82_9ACTN|nr:antibiotic biosynthesis monooxygenase [Nocardioides marmotae]MCR6033229.1 antibiotic biosynthesis monooxygenase [Gordonia jinghuaiqii]MBC9732737.1 antibiotic biosynthesis monooxygenase [Nocardioides marmotae]MTB83852.1 antibiotic biosynthesis monooxygenase [Nocardioides marmotae]MTB96884.1 antibiotic biosynthesis monooxygenase [Nocardioides marmotae]QKE02928.1 antibiotic biosynthesis monooxygenase [Nocardioides marmotae]